MNPTRALRGLGAATLVCEAIVLLLAIQPIRVLGGQLTTAAIVGIVVLAVLAVALAGLLRYKWTWYAVIGVQSLLVLGGFLHWSLAVLGVIFGLCWAYVLHVRRSVLSVQR